ncbi:GntR family transcriptional regulator [Clostridium chauvoei]|uniref:GntR family transcriptional regulator n=2 Tax=Clostridium chauvoei TaxID=46867 RepID=A0ABD4RKN6_9CLOT|nr:GntR family transcriptional regulator [Clostridium chauvoei]ATD54466.1 GntR family transcriptional regulator [Clostridium chauvoei]ATD57850.1 GntR family transcriptional regulator [Clostridium chauvoei]MBX7281702.1 GntR family transcriptional regulator [Clostridium chauvoei]MBX7284237.1 GntR family transcriptional regulator [Clostridium chauvoei]MBX7286750.1 GntR family transcriptional regulator [Clostridium chauvoei]
MKIVISNSSKLPIYEQIVNGIKQGIIEGEIKANEKLPSIRSLAKDLNISVITSKRAYDELEKQGFIETVGGKGSYVSYFNKELIYEEKLKEIENKLDEVIKTARTIKLKKEDVINIINLLYEGE